MSLILLEIEKRHSLLLSRIPMKLIATICSREISTSIILQAQFQLRGVRPFLSDKFDITKHKNYKLLEDYDKRNVFDIEEYIKRKGKAKMNGNTVITRL